MPKTDGELLQQFLASRDEDAFELLVQRHGAMAMGVCRRILRDEHDAEDAFQATFILLARKATSLRKRDSVGSWLHGVAMRVAMKAKTTAARRRKRERQAAMTDKSTNSARWRAIRPVLDEELDRLPERYRAPVLLCHFEGNTQKQAATLLGMNERTLKRRLGKARTIIRERLCKRGVALSTAILFSLIGENALAHAVPAGCVSSAVKAAAGAAAGEAAVGGIGSAKAMTLAKEVTSMMFWTKVKSAAAIAALTVGLSSVTVLGSIAVEKTNETASAVKDIHRDEAPVTVEGGPNEGDAREGNDEDGGEFNPKLSKKEREKLQKEMNEINASANEIYKKLSPFYKNVTKDEEVAKAGKERSRVARSYYTLYREKQRKDPKLIKLDAKFKKLREEFKAKKIDAKKYSKKVQPLYKERSKLQEKLAGTSELKKAKKAMDKATEAYNKIREEKLAAMDGYPDLKKQADAINKKSQAIAKKLYRQHEGGIAY